MKTQPTSTIDSGRLTLRDIDPALRQLWHESDTGTRAMARVRTLNLLVFVPANHYTQDVQRTIDELAILHPGRTITLVVSKESQPASAQVSLACRIGNEATHICGEQIMLYGGESGAPLVSTTTALVLPGVPVCLWWVGDPPFDSPVFTALSERADRMLLDASTWHSPFSTLRALAQTIQATSRLACTDTQWGALTSWRHSIAQCFDAHGALAQLPQLNRITITHGRAACDAIGAQLLVGWLASRLGWQPAQHQLRRTDNQLVDIALHSSEGDGIHAVALQSPQASITIARRAHSTCADLQVALPDGTVLQQIVSHTPRSRAALISDDLLVLGHDSGYEAALLAAAHLAVQ